MNPRSIEPTGGVTTRNLTKSFGRTTAVQDVSFEVAQGEFVSLLGPSGSGKSTILMAIAGFETPTTGEIWIGGRNMTAVPPHRRGVGMVFQSYSLFPHMMVAENIGFPLRIRRVPPAARQPQVEKMLDLINLPGYANRLPKQLSGGQQQRVAIARALIYEPPVLLMDEPLGALDRQLRDQMQLEIRSLQRRLGLTVIYVTHDQTEAITMSERIAVLKDGRLHQFDTPEILYTNPRDLFVAEFVGGSNFLDGRLLAKNGSEGIVELQGGARVVGTRAEASESKPDVGDPVRLAVRAEQVVTSIHVDGDHQLVGTLRERIFMGPVVANVIDLAGGVTITARSPTGMAGARHCAGDALALEWRAEDARIYRQDNRTEPAELDSSPPVETDSSLASHSS